MSEHREWGERIYLNESITALRNEHNATVRAYRDAMAELERIGKINDSMCDTIAELEKPAAVPERASDEELLEVFHAQRRAPNEQGSMLNAITAVRARVEAPLLAEIAAVRAELTALKVRVAPHDEQRSECWQILNDALLNLCPTMNLAHAVREAIDTLKARVAELEASCTMHHDRKHELLNELEAVKADRDEAKKSSELLAVVYQGEMDARKSLQSQLAALRQPVDADAWKVAVGGLSCTTPHSAKWSIDVQTNAQCATMTVCQDGTHRNCAISPADAARAAQWLASYANAHGCPVGLGQPLNPPLDAAKSKAEQGIYHKYNVTRTDGSDAPGGKHCGCSYFVLDRTHDKFAGAALTAYGLACATKYPELSRELLAAYPAPETRPVKVRFDVTAEEVRQHWFSIDGADVRAWQTMIDYLAAHAVLPVPAGVPSVEALVEIGRAAIPAGYHQSRYREEHFAIAIRNAVLASLPVTTPHEPTEAPSRSNAEMQICINRKNKRIDALKACVKKWKAKANAHSQKPATTHTGPTRAEAEAKWNECYLSRGSAYLDWLLPQLPTGRPEGMPSAEQLAWVINAAWRKHCKYPPNPAGTAIPEEWNAQADAALEYLTPWLREPTGWELDVTAEEFAAWKLQQFGSGNSLVVAQQSLDYLASRIRPTFGPCKECEKSEEAGMKAVGKLDAVRSLLSAARAALEGE